MEHNLARHAKNTTPVEAQKSQEVMNSQKKLITIEEISNFKKTICKIFTTFGF